MDTICTFMSVTHMSNYGGQQRWVSVIVGHTHRVFLSELTLLIRLFLLSLSPPSPSFPLPRFLLTCLCSSGVYLLSLLGILSFLPLSLARALSLSLLLYLCTVQLAQPTLTASHTPAQLASHKHSHTSLTEEVGHFNGDVWSAYICLQWIITWNCFLLPGRVYISHCYFIFHMRSTSFLSNQQSGFMQMDFMGLFFCSRGTKRDLRVFMQCLKS